MTQIKGGNVHQITTEALDRRDEGMWGHWMTKFAKEIEMLVLDGQKIDRVAAMFDPMKMMMGMRAIYHERGTRFAAPMATDSHMRQGVQAFLEQGEVKMTTSVIDMRQEGVEMYARLFMPFTAGQGRAPEERQLDDPDIIEAEAREESDDVRQIGS